ncbi:MAG: AMP-binding protein [Candidatus Gastranaerophilales bacterium]|nr:AMP-binding protein [Candidatus Gastranaerophilales bacterium]
MKLITDIFLEAFEKYGDKTAFIENKTGEKVTFSDFKNQTFKIVKILQATIQQPQEKIILYLKPQPMCHIIEIAALLSGNITICCDHSYNIQDVEIIKNKTNSQVIFTDNLSLIKQCKNHNVTIFYIGNDEDISNYNNENITLYNLSEHMKQISDQEISLQPISEDMIATIFFSSGTMGKPKGVVYFHKTLINAFLSHTNSNFFAKEGGCLSLLSSSHICPKFCDWMILTSGCYMIYSDYINYKRDIAKYKPLHILCVPKLLIMHMEDYYKALNKKNFYFKNLHKIFFDLSKKYIEKRDNNKHSIFDFIKIPILSLINFIGIKLIFNEIINEIQFIPKAKIVAFGAFVDMSVEIFYSVIGACLMQTYGSTEAATITYINDKYRKLGSVGKVNPLLSVIICNPETLEELPFNTTGLIKVKGSQTMDKYYENEIETANVYDENGYLSTGDMGYVTEDDFLFFKGRYKAVIVLNNGENVNPEPLEALCNNSNFVSQIIVAGQDKPYLSALIVPDKNYIEDWKKTNKNKNLEEEILIDINNILGSSQYFKWLYQIKKATLINEHFTQENGLLTKKFALNRNEIYNKYFDKIEEMYE